MPVYLPKARGSSHKGDITRLLRGVCESECPSVPPQNRRSRLSSNYKNNKSSSSKMEENYKPVHFSVKVPVTGDRVPRIYCSRYCLFRVTRLLH
ncbi:hypothetical protein CEXT_647161 [Caerostris extrusa]|uniref:Uncharacterized protein n=1 Tax=Caerostris extrusa TaxID=172846 RepID=A0AAV4UU04_CAEEX|nr:hypothetical protein CEXT_647161 [Caerostris extrusa]